MSNNKPYKRWRATIKEVGNPNVLQPELWGHADLDDARKHWGLPNRDVEWFTIEDVTNETD